MVEFGTQTPDSQKGAQLRIQYGGLSFRMGLLALAVNVLCILNGCSYYLYWRPHFLHVHSPPAALYTTAAGVFFLFVMTQLIVQLALRTMINHASFTERERQIRCCYIIFVVALAPATVGQMLLFARGWFDKSKPYTALFVVTAYLNIISGLCSLSYLWTSTCVNWIHMSVAHAALEKRAEQKRGWDKQIAYIVSTLKMPVSSLPLDSH
ncbi:hypothetical protein TraAM80_00566 [Trypanosoma rangeli]|uniref:Uncharacterized protein n=1 Tax=Trypanosoma rangeli TaxID=5698 RepID=A0A422P2P5_TRYRA|nr:uncharacterized protein TraAM80_00566 [Trypanosoma rangeli]RNF12006.1 hypothetical protein TraAM80_00566 [Trypanosoma rangeli]|eukprot:RNF12006.1 hypothetical protein TraAM80_00566 [Trypanosoma rangeli]